VVKEICTIDVLESTYIIFIKLNDINKDRYH